MKEYYIDDKVVILSKRLRIKNPVIAKMNRERHLHAICNKIHQEFAKQSSIIEGKMMDSIYKILKQELQ